MLAARVIAAVENPADVCVISPGPSVSVPFSSLQLPPEPLLLLEGSPLVLSLTRSKKLSVSHVCRLSPTHALIISPSLSHPTSTFQSLLSATPTLQPGSSTLPSHATTRESNPLVSSGGSSPEKYSGSVEPLPVNRNGMSCQTCTSSVTKTKSKRTKKLPRRQPRKKPKQPHRTGLLRQHQATGTTSQRSAQKLLQQLLVPREPPEPLSRELKPARSTTGQLGAPRPRRRPATGARTSRAAGNQWQPSDRYPLDFLKIL